MDKKISLSSVRALSGKLNKPCPLCKDGKKTFWTYSSMNITSTLQVTKISLNYIPFSFGSGHLNLTLKENKDPIPCAKKKFKPDQANQPDPANQPDEIPLNRLLSPGIPMHGIMFVLPDKLLDTLKLPTLATLQFFN